MKFIAEYKKEFEELLLLLAQEQGSDLHLSPGVFPTVRINGRLVPLTNRVILDKETLEGYATAIMGEENKERFLKNKESDFSYTIDEKARFRINIYLTRGYFALTARYISYSIRTIEELRLPSVVKMFSQLSQGFVLTVGPNGQGKSTTMAAMINQINKERVEKIITIEDPIEYLFVSDRSIIDQREVYHDTNSFDEALRSTFRENVNVIMLGEMRDLKR